MTQEMTDRIDMAKLQEAEDSLTRSLARFETAMERLAGKVEDSSHRVQHMIDIAKHQKDEFINLKNRTKEALDPVMPYLQKASDVGSKVIRRVKDNPKPYVWTLVGVAGIAGGILAYSYLKSKPSPASEALH